MRVPRGIRSRRVLMPLIVPLLIAAAGVWLNQPSAAAAADFTYQVTRNAAPYRDVPGTAVTFSAAAGDASYLWARNLSVRNVTPLAAGDNVGNTFAIDCRDATNQSVPGERGAYWAANLVPPGEKSLTPTLRWRFVAPTDGTYTCLIRITSYSTIITGGRTVTMAIASGATLARAAYPHSASWTLQARDATTIRAGSTVTTLGAGFSTAVGDANRIAVTQDAALSTCKQQSSIEGCSGGSSQHAGSTVRTWIEASPSTSTGAACGTTLSSTPVDRFISTAKHHLTATNTLYLNESQLAGCPTMRLTLKIRVLSGNPVRLHAGLAVGMAATHGVAFEYR